MKIKLYWSKKEGGGTEEGHYKEYEILDSSVLALTTEKYNVIYIPLRNIKKFEVIYKER